MAKFFYNYILQNNYLFTNNYGVRMKLSTTFRIISVSVLCLSFLVAVGIAGGKHVSKEQQESSQVIFSLSNHAGTGLPANVSVAEIKKQIQEHRSQIQQQKPVVNERDGRRVGGARETSSRGGEQHSPMSDISNFLIMRNVDMASGGYGGMRNSGVGTISTQPYTGTVLKAFLYWNGPTNSSVPDANSEVQFNGTTIFGDNIGFSDDNCWGFENSHAYRADVTDIVSANAGPYSLNGFLKESGNVNINGVSLIVFYDDGDSTNNRDYVVFDGNDSNEDNAYDVNGWNVMLNGINYSSGNASMILHVSDGQIWVDDNLYLNTVAITNTDQIFEGKSVPYDTVSANNTNGSMWDIKEFDITTSLVPGVNDVYLYTGMNNDCLALVVAVVSLPAGSAPTEFGTGKISGAKFLDANNNGLWDEGEHGIEGWQIVLSGADAETTETDPYGNYTFRNLLPGTYTISEINREQWTQTAPESSYSVTLDSGAVVDKLYFGNYPPPSSISGYKWEDANGNYEWDIDESGIVGWVIYHEYYDLNGYRFDSTVTDSTGYYIFANLTNGYHYIYEQTKPGWQQKYPFSYYYYFNIDEPGETYTEMNFGNMQVTPVTISGMKFNDLNNDGVKDEGEPGLANWVIHLYASDVAMKLMEKSPLAEGKKLETMPERIPYFKTTGGGGWVATTDSLGKYSFTDIYPGYYYAVEEPQEGWQQTYPSTSSWQIQVNSGIDVENIDFGNHEIPPPPPFVCGDVYASVNNGLVYRFSQDGTLIQVLNTGLGGFTTGMAFDSTGNLYVTNFSANSVSKFDTNGTNLGTFGSGYNGYPESILFDKYGNAYVGQAGSTIIKKFDATGNSIADFTVEIEDRGTDWIDIGGDQATMFYTSEGYLVKRYDVGTNTQLPDFGTLPERPAYALRLLPGGGALVAATGNIYRLDNLGNVVQTYDAEGQNQWFALNLDPDGRSFWSGDFATSEIYKFDIETGNVLTHFNTGTSTYTLFGLTVYCEVTAAPLYGSFPGRSSMT